MSSSLFLYKYPEGPGGRYIEETAQKIEECFISDAILEDIKDLEPWVKLEVFEEEGGDASNAVVCIGREKLVEVKRKLENIFIMNVRNAGVEQGDTLGIDESITNFRTICNIHFLLRLKIEKYEANDRVVIQLV